ncbi:hypothetical protein ACVW0Y_000285 [Pseudomonas sp. TE3786]
MGWQRRGEISVHADVLVGHFSEWLHASRQACGRQVSLMPVAQARQQILVFPVLDCGGFH